MGVKTSLGYVLTKGQDEARGQCRETWKNVSGIQRRKEDNARYLPRARASRTSSEVESNLELFDTICS